MQETCLKHLVSTQRIVAFVTVIRREGSRPEKQVATTPAVRTSTQPEAQLRGDPV